jgi:hypothetical protein
MTKAQVTHVTETITPEIAQKYLASNRLNRPLKEWRIKLLQNDMENNHFVENGEAGITFDWNGNIAGGQHTLTAVVRSGVAIKVRVTRGVNPAVRATMNDSLHQRFSDDLTVSGVNNGSQAEPLVRKVIVWERVARENKGLGGLATWRNTRMSRASLSAEWPIYAAGITATLAVTANWHDLWRGVGNRGAMQLFYWVLTEKYGFTQEIAEDYFSRIVYGSQEWDRVLFQKLGRKLAENNSAEQQVYWLMRVWNAWVTQEKIAKLQAPKSGYSDPYPKLRRPNR